MEQSEQIDKLAEALAAAQGAMKGAAKDSTNPHFRSSYADLASCWDACREALSARGLAVYQGASAEAERVTVSTMLLHSSGQWVRSCLTMTARDGSPQSVGSTVTYGRRYGLMAAVGIAPEDDDGEAAEGRSTQKQAPRLPPAPKQQETKPKPAPKATEPPAADDEAARKKGLASVHAKAAEKGLEHGDVAVYAYHLCGRESMADLTVDQLRTVYRDVDSGKTADWLQSRFA